MPIPWDYFHAELYTEAVSGAGKGWGNSGNKGQQNFRAPINVPRGFCVHFHTGTHCHLPCKYKHKCFHCPETHSTIGCQGKRSKQHRAASTGTNSAGWGPTSARPTLTAPGIANLPTPVQPEALARLLVTHPNQKTVVYLLDGFYTWLQSGVHRGPIKGLSKQSPVRPEDAGNRFR